MDFETFFNKYFVENMPCSFTYNKEQAAPKFGQIEKISSVEGSYDLFERKMISDDGKLCAALKIRRYPQTAEWWLELTNPKEYDSNLVENIAYADVTTYSSEKYFGTRFPRVTVAAGSVAHEYDFRPEEVEFITESHKTYRNTEGRASSGVWPYFNVQNSKNYGVLFAIGWNGQWKADFDTVRSTENCYRPIKFRTYLEYASFRVRPAEVLELPHMTAMPWEGEIEESFNTWRRFMRDFILPRYDGKPLQGHTFMRAWGGLSGEIHSKKLKNVKDFELGAEAYQIDAGWHGDKTTPVSTQSYFDIWYKTVGIWEPLPHIFPDGLVKLRKDCNDAKMDLCVWFEPERMTSNIKHVKEHPDYFLGSRTEGGNMLLNLGNPEAREWILRTLDKVIDESGLKIFRIDFNMNPLSYWQAADLPDRKGITEICYVNGVYKLLDELLRRHPGLEIDNCASGGRRNEYRMFRRGMPMLCRSDYMCFQDNLPEGKQCHTYGLSMWCPAHADSIGSCIGHTPEVMDTYRARSSMCSGIGITAPWWDISEEEAAWYRKMFAEASLVRKYASCDFYGLTGYTLSHKDWIAWQFGDRDTGSGIVMAFRRENNATPVMYFELKGIDVNAVYSVKSSERDEVKTLSGKELSECFAVSLPEKRSSAIIEYKKL